MTATCCSSDHTAAEACCTGPGICGPARLRISASVSRKSPSPAAKPERMPGRFERLDSELKTTRFLKRSGVRGGDLEAAGRRLARVDLGVALVEEQHEVVLARQRQGLAQIVGAGDGALRVGGRAQEEGRRASQDVGLARERIEVGQMAGLGGGVEIDGLAAGAVGAAEVGLIERIGQQHHGAAGESSCVPRPACAAKNRPSREPLSGSTSRAKSTSVGRQ